MSSRDAVKTEIELVCDYARKVGRYGLAKDLEALTAPSRNEAYFYFDSHCNLKPSEEAETVREPTNWNLFSKQIASAELHLKKNEFTYINFYLNSRENFTHKVGLPPSEARSKRQVG